MVGLYDSFIHPFVVLLLFRFRLLDDVSFSINQQFIEYLYNLRYHYAYWTGV
jgi:hypothetical protein